ncbi:PAS domain-containing hybrid sensor histidine kinase/response regulator [Malikia sp.]|uniref:PAS domain-containing hybrid sensor histidine kinase/response regulator n=1 Tax=Malikia sp. TaxID=2070706 RepID=UPI00261E5EB3|nr:PAS domain-containing hybrid sensor histidine kinase/response regulator [Malikia sp.]MDD2729190.1 ATP-binding protein [Malikia sp.]
MQTNLDFDACDGTRSPPAVPLDELLSVAGQAAGVAAWDWDLVSGVLHWSPEIWPLFGFDATVRPSLEHWRAVLHPDDVQGASQLIAHSIQQRQPFVTSYRVILPSGATRWLDAYGRPFHDEAGRPIRFAGINVDATARVQAEQYRHQAELRDVARQAEQRQFDQRQRYQAFMNHEIRTPVHAMLLLAETLVRQDIPAAAADLVRQMRDVAQVLQGLLDRSLDFSRLEARRLEPERLAFDLGEMFDLLESIFSVKSEQRGLEFRITPPAAGWRALIGDRYRLGQILGNLIGNALKFTASGQVALSVELLEQSPRQVRLRFVVQDTGSGIDPVLQQQLFQPFVQSDSSIGRQFGGAGLGLAICRELVELMGGEIGCDSVPGMGSRFWFTLSFARQASPALAVPEPHPAAPLPQRTDAEPLAEVRVLLVEDEPVGRELFARLLAAEGARVHQVEHGRAALDWLELHPAAVDVVLMDLNMPVMGGLVAVSRLRESPVWSRLPVLAMSADSQLQARDAALAAGMNDFFIKPFRVDDVVASIQQQLNLRQGVPHSAATAAAASAPLVEPAGVVMNPAHGLAVCAGEEAYRHYLGRFLERYQSSAAELQSPLADRNGLQDLAHQLKSTASYLGLEQVVAVAREADGVAPSPDQLDVLRWRLHAALTEAFAAIAARRNA